MPVCLCAGVRCWGFKFRVLQKSVATLPGLARDPAPSTWWKTWPRARAMAGYPSKEEQGFDAVGTMGFSSCLGLTVVRLSRSVVRMFTLESKTPSGCVYSREVKRDKLTNRAPAKNNLLGQLAILFPSPGASPACLVPGPSPVRVSPMQLLRKKKKNPNHPASPL